MYSCSLLCPISILISYIFQKESESLKATLCQYRVNSYKWQLTWNTDYVTQTAQVAIFTVLQHKMRKIPWVIIKLLVSHIGLSQQHVDRSINLLKMICDSDCVDNS